MELTKYTPALDWCYSLIGHPIDEPILLEEAQDLLDKVQAHLLLAMSFEHPAVLKQYNNTPTR